MIRRLRVRSVLAAAIALVGAVALVTMGSATAAPTSTLFTRMTGAEEVPPRVTPGGGTAVVYVDAQAQTVCINYNFGRLTSPATAGHIHEGPPGVIGPVRIPFPGVPALGGGQSFCADTDAEFTLPPGDTRAAFISRLENNPGNFYVNIHSQTYPGGEIRGQLSLLAQSTTTTTLIP